MFQVEEMLSRFLGEKCLFFIIILLFSTHSIEPLPFNLSLNETLEAEKSGRRTSNFN